MMEKNCAFLSCVFFYFFFQLKDVFWGDRLPSKRLLPVITVPLHALYTSLKIERDRGDVEKGVGGGKASQ